MFRNQVSSSILVEHRRETCRVAMRLQVDFGAFMAQKLLNVHVYKSLLPVHRSQSILCSAVRSRRCDMESSGPHTPDRICHGSSKARICSCWTQGMLLTLLHVFTFIAHLSWSPCACAVSKQYMIWMQSSTHIVLASIKRTSAEMGTFQRKLFKIDDHLGIGVSGLISDGRNLCIFMRNECLSHR